ncbi:CBO0543 family protein [Paenibacillus sp. PL91]|uniref:CBO0543 family protein n=1 Tax=Paenibacillus sp. PL91 TaxID=2729538 RepID=UPI00294FFAB2|nr:CBO0543 family protein [Paenibacillus sp. PL91]
MITNIIIGFFIPWIFGIYLYKRAPVIILLICPITAIMSTVINAVGYQLEFWRFTPLIKNVATLSSLPFDIGFYPVMTSYLIYWIRQNNQYPFLKIVCIGLLTTILELIAYLFGKVEYSNHWNIGWTFVSYVIPYILIYLYYRLLSRYVYSIISKK